MKVVDIKRDGSKHKLDARIGLPDLGVVRSYKVTSTEAPAIMSYAPAHAEFFVSFSAPTFCEQGYSKDSAKFHARIPRDEAERLASALFYTSGRDLPGQHIEIQIDCTVPDQVRYYFGS